MELTAGDKAVGAEEPDLVIKIRELNPHIVCSLCAGYFIDATTITECSHTFCKSCIVKYFQTKRSCPQCGQKVSETHPLNDLRSDRVMQDVVYKLVPNLFKSEQEAEAKFYSSKGMDFTQSGSHLLKIGTPLKYTSQKVERDVGDEKITKVDVSSIPNCQKAHSMHYDEKIVLYLDMHQCMKDDVTFEEESGIYKGVRFHPLKKRFIRCSSRVNVLQVKKLLKLLLFRNNCPTKPVEIFICSKNVELDDRTIMRKVFLDNIQSLPKDAPYPYIDLTFYFSCTSS